MSDAKETPAAGEAPAAAAPAATTKIEVKFNGKTQAYDLADPTQAARVQALVQMGMLGEKQKERLDAAQARVKELEQDATLGKGWRDFAASDRDGAQLLGSLMTQFREGKLTPNQVRDRLVGRQDGESSSEAQTRAAEDPQTRALLIQFDEQLRTANARIEGFEQRQARREIEAEIKSAVSGIDFLRGKPAAQKRVMQDALQRVSADTPLDVAVDQAAAEYAEMLNEAAESERKRLEKGKEMDTVNPNQGIPPVREFMAGKVDPKAPRHVQEQQRKQARLGLFQAIKAAKSAVSGGPSQ